MLAYWKYKMSFMKIQRIELKPLFWHLSCFVFITIIIDLLLEKDFVGPLDFCPDNASTCAEDCKNLRNTCRDRCEVAPVSGRPVCWHTCKKGFVNCEERCNYDWSRTQLELRKKKKFPFDFIKIVLNNLCRLTVIKY